MKLQARIRRLELRSSTGPASDSGERLRAFFDRMAARIIDSEDSAHNPNDSVAQNVARAFVRGDDETARALLQGALAHHEAR